MVSDDESTISECNSPAIIVKRRPGRPKKQIERKAIPREGIVAEPYNKELEESDPSLVNVIEIVYENPSMWKKIFHLFKTMSVDEDIVRILFDHSGVKMYAKDHVGTNEIYVKIHGHKMNRYYCESPLEIGLNIGNIYKILQTLTKECGQIIISTDRQNRTSSINIVISNDEMDEDSKYKVSVNEISFYNWAVESDLEREIVYPIRFELPTKYFKKKIADFGSLCEVMRIEKNGHDKLRFSYTFNDNHGDHNSYFNNSGKINLVSYLNEDDIFSSSVLLTYIDSLSKALIADDITIAADTVHNLIFTAYIDQEEREYAVSASQSRKYKVAGTENCIVKIITATIKT